MRFVDGRLVYAASDLNDYLTCPHRVALNRRALTGAAAAPPDEDRTLALIARKGREFERRELERREASGAQVVRIPEGDASVGALLQAAEATRAAMRGGAEVIYQATFLDGAWTGRADFLVRTAAPSALGAWSYDVEDTKLAVAEKPEFLIQLCTYALLVERVQGTLPQRLVAVFGDGRRGVYETERFAPYVRLAQARFLDAVAALRADAVPDRIAACEACVWQPACVQARAAVDHLSQVAGMRRDQTKRLAASGIATLEALATAPDAARPARMADTTFVNLRRQAMLQFYRRTTGSNRYELLQPAEGHGFGWLPRPARGDVYFDMEGDPLYEAGAGLEYLFGAYVPDDEQGTYRAFWGETREGERRAFEAFVDWLVEHRRVHPAAHVYHYASYEKSALRRLAQRHATREDEVDELLRGEVLVDLYAVVRGALAQSQDGYSIKKLEPFYGFERTADVRKGDQSIVAFEEYLFDRDDERKDDIVRYNEEDCVSTERLHRWLLALADEARALFGVDVAFRSQRDPKEPTEAERLDRERLSACQRELLDAPESDQTRTLLAHLLSYHEREDKPVWWALFDRQENAATRSFVDDDSDALGGLEPSHEHPPEMPNRTQDRPTYTYRFPPQQHKMGAGTACDPHHRDAKALTIEAIDEDLGLVRVKKHADAPHPRALVPGGPLDNRAQRRALERLAVSVLDGTAVTRYGAAWDILRRARPRITGIADGGRVQPLPPVGVESIPPADVADLARRLDAGTLVVQGPPGTGKTYAGAEIIATLLADGKRIGVTSTSHKAIDNLLRAVEARVAERGESFRGVKKCNGGDTSFRSERAASFVENAKTNAPFDDYDLVAGTAWLFARADLAPVDYLVIDEAGQVSLADALAMATNTRNVILLGDPLQLAHVSLASHPDGAEVSVLQHLLAGEGTVPEDRGVFLDRTFRMHPSVCAFVSSLVYGGRLHAASECALQRIDSRWFSGAGLRYVAVDHERNAQSSEEEAAEVERVVGELVGATFTDRFGVVRPMGVADILVVSPYNAQVRLLTNRLRRRFGPAVRVGTVDKFQGQEAPVVIYSLAASSAEDARRGIDFLFDENRFNVAVSRGRALAVLVCSPRLLETRCSTVEQLRAVSAFCAFAREARS